MQSPDSSDFTFTVGHPDLLSEPSIFLSGSGQDDLSISDLSLSNRTVQRPFSLLAAPPKPGPSTLTDDGGNLIGDGADDVESAENIERNKRHATKLREEKLQSDLFILKKLNSAFALFHKALDDTGSSNEVRCPHIK
jgi:hypothetical protein